MDSGSLGTPVPSTPSSWMTGQRQRRPQRRGYGRRFSGAASATAHRSSRSFTAVASGRRRATAAAGGEAASARGDVLDQSAHARLEGRRNRLHGLPPSAVRYGGAVITSPDGNEGIEVELLDSSAHARLEQSRSSRLDLADEFERTAEERPAVKKKRANEPLPRRPPLPRATRATAGGGGRGREDGQQFSAVSAHFSTPKVDGGFVRESSEGTTESHGSCSGSKSVFDFEDDDNNNNNNNNIASFGSQDNFGVSDRNATCQGGHAKRSKYHRSNSASTMAASSSSLFEENVHPNDTAMKVRRSSRLAKTKAHGNNKSLVQAANQSMQRDRESVFRGPRTVNPTQTTQRTRRKAKDLCSSSTFVQQSGKDHDGSDSATTSSSFITTRSRAKSNIQRRSLTSASARAERPPPRSPSTDPRSPSTTSFASGSSSTFASLASTRQRTGAGSDGSSCDNESFTNLARRGSGRNLVWQYQRSMSSSAAAPTTPASPDGTHYRSSSCGGGVPADAAAYLSPKGGSRASPTALGSGSASSRKRPVEFTSSPVPHEEERPPPLGETEKMPPETPFAPFGLRRAVSEGLGATAITVAPLENSLSLGKSRTSEGYICFNDRDLEEEKMNGARDRLSSDSDESMKSAMNDNGNSSASEDDTAEEDDDEMPREMTDAEIFSTKSSYHDFKLLIRWLQKWSKSSGKGKGCSSAASMGLNTGCLIAVPPGWTLEHRASFARWVATSFGFRVGSVGGTGCGSFLQCGDVEGRAALGRLQRILREHKAGRLVAPKQTKGEIQVVGSKQILRNSGDCALTTETKSIQRPFLLARKSPSMPSFINDFGVDLLTNDMRTKVSLDEKTPAKSHCGAAPRFFKSLLQKKSTPRLGIRSPAGDVCRRSVGVRGSLPRLSAEGAVNNSGLIDQLHGISGSSPRPPPCHLPRRLPEMAAGRVVPPPLDRPSLGSRRRCSFERPSPLPLGCLQPFESPHPRTTLAHEIPASCLETPMPKQIENWGSRPILGKDWGESVCCQSSTINVCSQVFAASWFTSDFYRNEDLSSSYQIALDEKEETSLFTFYDEDNNRDSVEGDGKDIEFPCAHDESLDHFQTDVTSKNISFARCDSVGASAMDLLHLDDRAKSFSHSVGVSAMDLLEDKAKSFCHSPSRKRSQKLRKYARMSLCFAAAPDFVQEKEQCCYRHSVSPNKKWPLSSGNPITHVFEDNTAFPCVLSFLNEGELIHSVALVCSFWADTAAEALGNLMRVSVGCDPSLNDNTPGNCSSKADEADSVDTHTVASLEYSSVAKSMERDWSFLMERFPWAKFLSDGSFKRVYQVWNGRRGAYEALSVMDVDAIDDSGNLELVATELAVGVLLAQLARRNICPNFVIMRGVFTCQHEPPAMLWGCKDDATPTGATYDGRTRRRPRVPKPNQGGNYQYIRMELCQHGDIENYIKSHPEKMLAPLDCRNLLFQMAFALFVAADRFGLKHYDVKLLNFFLQSATDVTMSEHDHPHVVLRYGVGAHVFRLRMHPSTAFIAKLADYGTSVTRTRTDGQPVTIAQFTTLENTPPDYLILGNTAVQGHGHDCFGLGLCMLHLFTGHAPYEEILERVVCPENLKAKLRKIWRQKSHNVIRSVMFDNDDNGLEVEDQTLYDTIYRYLVLFGIPKKQFDRKKHGKVWHAINSTLLCPESSRKKSPESEVFNKDRQEFSLENGSDKRITHARQRLLSMDGAMELLLSLVSFDPKERATPLDAINSKFMRDLIEDNSASYCEKDITKSFTAYLAN